MGDVGAGADTNGMAMVLLQARSNCAMALANLARDRDRPGNNDASTREATGEATTTIAGFRQLLFEQGTLSPLAGVLAECIRHRHQHQQSEATETEDGSTDACEPPSANDNELQPAGLASHSRERHREQYEQMLVPICGALANMALHEDARHQLVRLQLPLDSSAKSTSSGQVGDDGQTQEQRGGGQPGLHTSALAQLAKLLAVVTTSASSDGSGLGSKVTRQVSPNEMQVARYAAGALANISLHTEYIGALVELGIVQRMVDIIAQASAGSATQSAEGDAGGAASSTITDARLLANATAALRNLAFHPSVREQLIEAGAVRPLVRLWSHSADNSVLANAVGALVNLGLHSSAVPQV
jgi:hypothetical protein